MSRLLGRQQPAMALIPQYILSCPLSEMYLHVGGCTHQLMFAGLLRCEPKLCHQKQILLVHVSVL